MNVRQSCVGIIMFVFLASIFLLSNFSYSQVIPFNPPVKKEHPKLQSGLVELADIDEKKGPFHRDIFARERNIKVDDGNRVTVYVFAHPDSPTNSIDINRLKAHDVDVVKSADSVMKVRIPLNRLRRLVDDLDSIAFVALPPRPSPQAIKSEGISLTAASTYHSAGYTGQGVKVAVLDTGFQFISVALLNGDLPSNMYVIDCTGTYCFNVHSPWDLFQSEGHGTAVAEIVHDMAPSAELYLVKVDDPLDAITAYNQFRVSNVRIVNHSVGWFNQNFGSGECYYSNSVCTVNTAFSEGILWVNAAGNHAKKHYSAVFTDSSLNNWHEVSPGNEVIRFYAKYLDPINVHLTWDAWPATNQDYDLYLFDYNMNNLTSSRNAQIGSQPPVESISFVAPYTGYYNVAISRYWTTANHRLSLFSDHELSPYVAAGSIVSPGDALWALTVGAVDYPYWTSGPIANYSSQGPTNDGRIKPDIVAPASVSTFYYGPNGFAGTSAAAPHVAGAAALVLSKNPTYSVWQLGNALVSSAIDMGLPGQDNVFGFGRLSLPPTPIPITVTTSPPALPVIVDGNPAAVSPQTYNWTPGTNHTIGVVSPFNVGVGMQWGFSSWSDGGAQTHTISAPASPRTYTATFGLQYQLTTAANPPGSGSVYPDCSLGCWYGDGVPLSLTASAGPGYTFTGWTGSVNGMSNPLPFAMNAPKTIIANFGPATTPITVTTNPSPLPVVVDGNLPAFSPQTFNWISGSSHTIGVISPHSVGAGMQWVFSSWSDGGARTHTISAPASTTLYIANFKLQNQLTTSVNPPGAGTVNPACSGGCWYDAGSVVNLNAAANTGNVFTGWTGAVTVTSNPVPISIDTPRSITANFTACSYSIAPAIQPFNAFGGQGSFDVIAPSGCPWTAVSNNPSWLTITDGASGNGNGSVLFQATDNQSGSGRIGTIAVAGKTFAVTQAGIPPVVSFTGLPLSGEVPLYVAFSDTSSNTPTSWSWDFGDGGTSTQRNPGHTYRTAGTYSVFLTVANSFGSDATTIKDYVQVLSCSLDPVRIGTNYFLTLVGAYGSQYLVDGSTIEMQAHEFIGDLDHNQSTSMTLKGGFNCGYTETFPETVLRGMVTITAGTIIFDGITIQ